MKISNLRKEQRDSERIARNLEEQIKSHKAAIKSLNELTTLLQQNEIRLNNDTFKISVNVKEKVRSLIEEKDYQSAIDSAEGQKIIILAELADKIVNRAKILVRCSQCKSEINQESKFCPICGTPVQVIDQNSTPSPIYYQPIQYNPKNKNISTALVVIVIIVSFLIIAAAYSVVMSNGSDGNGDPDGNGGNNDPIPEGKCYYGYSIEWKSSITNDIGQVWNPLPGRVYAVVTVKVVNQAEEEFSLSAPAFKLQCDGVYYSVDTVTYDSYNAVHYVWNMDVYKGETYTNQWAYQVPLGAQSVSLYYHMSYGPELVYDSSLNP